MSNLPIGVLDSGIGGASILKKVFRSLPNEKFIYFADNKNMPYGNKSKIAVFKIIRNNVQFLIKKYNIKMLIIACNTASSVSLLKLRKIFKIPIIGIEPAIKPAIECGYKKILILATNRTLKSNRTIKSSIKSVKIKNKSLNKNNKIIIKKKAIKNLAFQIDKNCNNLNNIQDLLDKNFKKYKNFDALIIGCTHFNFIKKQIQKSLPYTKLISCETAIVKRTKFILERERLKNNIKTKHKVKIILTKHNFRLNKFLENYLKIKK